VTRNDSVAPQEEGPAGCGVEGATGVSGSAVGSTGCGAISGVVGAGVVAGAVPTSSNTPAASVNKLVVPSTTQSS